MLFIVFVLFSWNDCLPPKNQTKYNYYSFHLRQDASVNLPKFFFSSKRLVISIRFQLCIAQLQINVNCASKGFHYRCLPSIYRASTYISMVFSDFIVEVKHHDLDDDRRCRPKRRFEDFWRVFNVCIRLRMLSKTYQNSFPPKQICYFHSFKNCACPIPTECLPSINICYKAFNLCVIKTYTNFKITSKILISTSTTIIRITLLHFYKDWKNQEAIFIYPHGSFRLYSSVTS